MSSNIPAPRSRIQSHQPPNPATNTLIQSRETGEVVPSSQRNVVTIAEQPSPLARSWAHFVAGALGGMTSSIATAPLDVLKTRLQSDFYQTQLISARASKGLPPLSSLSLPRSALLHISETFQILFAVRRIEGWRAYFKGLGPTLVGVVPARAINFFTYGNGKRVISHYFNDGKESSWVHLCAAANAGIVTGTATCPIWVVKTRLQLDRNRAESVGAHSARRYKNALDCTLQTLRYEGIRGLYRGLGASYLGVTESTFQWVLYERMKLALARREESVRISGRPLNLWDRTIEWAGYPGSAGLAKSVAAVVTYPHEVVRTRLRQAPQKNGQVKYNGIIQCIKLVYREEGMAAMYGGLVPHMLRVVPSAAIMFGVYEGTLKMLGTDSGV